MTGTTGAGASAYTSDADGNTLSTSPVSGGGRTLAWDSQNRLASCTLNGITSTYTYGADGQRRRAFTLQQFQEQPLKHGATTQDVTLSPGSAIDIATSYAYDGTMLVREGHARSANGVSSLQPGSVTATYLIGARGPEYRRDDTAQETDSQGRTVTKARWYVYDGLGSVVGEVDPAGNLTSSPKYDVYGATRSNGGTATSQQGFVGALGHVSDDTGLIYMKARYYDPSIGRFISEDPHREGGNWLTYANNNPVTNYDPDGCSLVNEALGAFFYYGGLAIILAAAFGCGGPGMAAMEWGMAVSAVESFGAAAVSIAIVAITQLTEAISGANVDPGLVGVAARASILDIASAIREAGILSAICPIAARLGAVIIGSVCMLEGAWLEDE